MNSSSHRTHIPRTPILARFNAGKLKIRQASALILYEKEHFLTLIWHWRCIKKSEREGENLRWNINIQGLINSSSRRDQWGFLAVISLSAFLYQQSVWRWHEKFLSPPPLFLCHVSKNLDYREHEICLFLLEKSVSSFLWSLSRGWAGAHFWALSQHSEASEPDFHRCRSSQKHVHPVRHGNKRPGAMLQLCNPSPPKQCCLPSCSANREPFAEELWCYLCELPILWIPHYLCMKSNGRLMPAWTTNQHITSNRVSRCLQCVQT